MTARPACRRDVARRLDLAHRHDADEVSVPVRVARQELAMPPKISLEQVKGFALYTTRTILSGNGDEIIELAKSNLRQLVKE